MLNTVAAGNARRGRSRVDWMLRPHALGQSELQRKVRTIVNGLDVFFMHAGCSILSVMDYFPGNS